MHGWYSCGGEAASLLLALGGGEMVAEGRRWRKGCRGRMCKGKWKGKRPKCPTVDGILEKL